jgi:hypothetical protein
MKPWSGCLDCIMAWLLFGDGAVCLAGHGRVSLSLSGGNVGPGPAETV